MWSIVVEYFPDWKIWSQALATMLFALVVYFIHKRLFALGDVEASSQKPTDKQKKQQLTGNYDTDLQAIKQQISKNGDVHFRDFRISIRSSRATLIFVEGLQNEEQINRQVMQNLMDGNFQRTEGYIAQNNSEAFATYMKEKLLPISKINEVTELYELEQSILLGFTAMLIEGLPHALLVGEPTPKVRAIEEPVSEGLLRGPRTGFTEVLGENTALLRQHGRAACR